MNSGGDSTSGSMSGEDIAVVDSPGTIQFESSTDQPERTAPPTGVILQGDCVELMRALPEESIGWSLHRRRTTSRTAPETA